MRVYAQAAEASVGYLRTYAGEREVDLIVERGDGRVVALEVELNPVATDQDVRHLKWLREQMGDDLLDAVVVTTGADAYRRPDGIAASAGGAPRPLISLPSRYPAGHRRRTPVLTGG